MQRRDKGSVNASDYAMQSHKGNKIFDREDINEVATKFYEDLYKRENECLIFNTQLRNEITEEELDFIMKELNLNVSQKCRKNGASH